MSNQPPLEGLTVLDFSRLLPGPLASLHFADLGARVIKIEDTKMGDYGRNMPPLKKNYSPLFLILNRNKESFAIDYTQKEAQKLLIPLIKQADILLESFRPGQMAKWGLDYETLKEINPALVYVSITGFGQTGSFSHLAGHDINFVSLSGLSDQMGNAEKPNIPNFQLGDIVGGSLMAAFTAVSAVLSAKLTGKGRYLDVSMLEGLISNMSILQNTYLAFGQTLERGKDILTGALAFYNIYQTKDKRFFAVGAVELKFWKVFCEICEKPDWIEKHWVFGEHAEQMIQNISELFASQDFNYWVEKFAGKDCCVTPVLDLPESMNLPVAKERNWLQHVSHPTEGEIPYVRFPVLMDNFEPNPIKNAPEWGQDTDVILKSLEFSDEEIKDAKKSKLIF